MIPAFKKYTLIMLAAMAVLFTSCVDDDDNGNIIPGNNSILDQTMNNADLSMLNTALVRTGLNDTFANAGTYTFFAPNNSAFSNYLTVNGIATIEDIPIGDLRTLLLYHVLNTEVTTDLLTNGYVKTLGKDEEIESLDLFLEAGTPVILNGTASVVEADSDADNGVIHIIDSVLELPTISDLIAANPDFDNLETALAQTGLDISLSSTDGSMLDPFTVFAPNNAAFDALINSSTTDGLNDIADVLALTNLNDILLYHVEGNNRIRSGDISNGFMVTPLSGAAYTIDTTTGVQFTDGSMTLVTITSTDVTAVNGIIHTIDFVARPM